MKKIAVIVYLVIVQSVFGQLNVDSLWQIYHNPNETDSTRLMAMWYIAYDVYLYNNPDTSLILAQEMYDFAKEKGELEFQAYALGTQATASYYLGRLDSAIVLHQRALIIHQELENYGAMAACYNNIANVYREWGQLAEALDYFLKALKIYEKLDSKPAISTVYGNIGSIYSDLQDYENSQMWYRKALDMKMETDDQIGIALILTGIGEGHLDKGNYDSAMYYQRKSLNIRIHIENQTGIANSLKHIGYVHMTTGNLDSAMFYYRKSLTYLEKLNLQSGLTDAYSCIAIIYERQKKFNEALSYAQKAFNIANGSGYLDAERDASFMLFKLHKQKGNFREALAMHEIYISMRDSMNKEANQKAVLKQQFQYEYDKKAIADSLRFEDERRLEKLKHDQQTKNQKFVTVTVAFGLGLVVLFLIFVFNRLRVTRKQKAVIEAQKIEVEKQKTEVELAHHELEEKNQEIMDSITYAKRIQSAILPSHKVVKSYLRDSFILYKPKDIVAGDFYWLESLMHDTAATDSPSGSKAHEETLLFAAADCTGHGVPGAMVSVVCNGALNRAVREFGLMIPGKILDKAREIVIQEFEKSDEEVKDGMDISLCSLSPISGALSWSGANNPLWIIRKDSTEVTEIKPDKQPIGKFANPKPFQTHHLSLNVGDSVYIFTDGYQDQFGGEKGKKFKASSLKSLLLSIQHLSMDQQKIQLETAFETWRGKLEQIDDVCIIGVRI